MVKVKELKNLTIQEAMDNLAAIVGIDLENPPRLGIIQQTRLVTDADKIGPQQVVWLSSEGSEAILEILDMTFSSLHHHLIILFENPETEWNQPKVQKGILAMLSLAEEAARKIDRYLAFREGRELPKKTQMRPSFQELQFFYQHHISKKIKGEEDSWSQSEPSDDMVSLMAGSKNGLKEFEMVKRDQEYELFMIRNEDGKTYFTPALLRNIKMVCFEVGEEVSFEEDPLLRVRAMEDRDLQASAKQILLDCERVIEDFYKEAKHLEDVALAQYLSMAILALFLAANPRNLIQNTSGKSSLDYFQDFHQFIRRAMNSAEYQKFIAYPPDATDVVSHHLLHMTHFLCRAFFYRLGGVKQESIGLLHRCMRKGGEGNPKTILKGESIWSQFMIDDEQFRSLLKAFPNGPLFKILDLMQEEEVELMTFDPMLQGNLPQSVGFLEVKGKKIELLRMPSPTRQSMINKAALAEEFLGLLRAYGAYSPKKKHLIINLQDRTSWKEFARCSVLEKLQHNAEFCDQLVVMTLPKHTDFYYQNSEYLSVNDAEDFIEQFREQLRSSQECGFFFPTQLSKQEFMNFAEAAFSLIHAQVFNGQKNLTRRNREDFIEFFYQLLILKMIDTIQPDSISFSCKDAIDTGATSLGMFFGFVELLKGDIAAQIDYLRWLFYMPALFIRERAVDPERLTRILAALEQFDSALAKQDGTFVKALSSLYSAHLIKTLEVRHR